MRSYPQRKSRLQEKRAAADVNGRVQKASGATDFAKGDVRTFGEIRVECKGTQSDEYRLQVDDLKKIQEEALRGGEDWTLQLEFVGRPLPNRFAVLSHGTLMEMWRTKPKSYMGLYLQDCFQMGKSHLIKLDDLISAESGAYARGGLTSAIFITFNIPNHPELGQPRYALISWNTYKDLRESQERLNLL